MKMNNEDKARTFQQADAILERLRRGPALNTELAQMALKYTSRISDLRKRGFVVRCERRGGGLTEYTLVWGTPSVRVRGDVPLGPLFDSGKGRAR